MGHYGVLPGHDHKHERHGVNGNASGDFSEVVGRGGGLGHSRVGSG